MSSLSIKIEWFTKAKTFERSINIEMDYSPFSLWRQLYYYFCEDLFDPEQIKKCIILIYLFWKVYHLCNLQHIRKETLYKTLVYKNSQNYLEQFKENRRFLNRVKSLKSWDMEIFLTEGGGFIFPFSNLFLILLFDFCSGRQIFFVFIYSRLSS